MTTWTLEAENPNTTMGQLEIRDMLRKVEPGDTVLVATRDMLIAVDDALSIRGLLLGDSRRPSLGEDEVTVLINEKED